MLGTRHEEYSHSQDGLPFRLHPNLERTPHLLSDEQNWHDDLEIQLCVDGDGEVLLNGKAYPFSRGDVAVVNSNVIHYTGTNGHLTYTCLIVSTEFCRSVGIDCQTVTFSPLVKSDCLARLMSELTAIYLDSAMPLRVARLHEKLLELLIELATHHAAQRVLPPIRDRAMKTVKNAIKYIREGYGTKLTLDLVARAVYTDKYTLCRNFKRLTGQTVVEYINRYRCQKAAEHMAGGLTVAEAARLCGFENLSFFSKTFKRYMGTLPSSCKK